MLSANSTADSASQSSRYAETQKYSPFVSPISYATLGAFTLYVILVVVLVTLRRNLQPIKSRNALLIVIHTICVYLTSVNAILRFAVDGVYPCYVSLLGTVFGVGANLFPMLLKVWRLYFVFKLSILKTFFTSLKNKIKNNNNVLGRKSTVSAETMAERAGSITASAQRIEVTVTQKPKSKLSQLFARNHEKSKALLEFWISDKFIIIVFIVVLILHSVVYPPLAIFGVAADGTCIRRGISTSVILVQFLLYFGAIFGLLGLSFFEKIEDRWNIRSECIMLLLFWLVMLVIYAFNTLTDARYWPFEYYLPHASLISFAAAIDIFFTGYVPLFGTFYKHNNFIYQTKDSSEKTSKKEKDLVEVLNDLQLREMFKRFCIQSFCPESILFWEEVHTTFKALPTDEERYIFAKQLVARYIERGSPLELNLTKREELKAPIIKAIQEYEAVRKRMLQKAIEDVTYVAPLITVSSLPRGDSTDYELQAVSPPNNSFTRTNSGESSQCNLITSSESLSTTPNLLVTPVSAFPLPPSDTFTVDIETVSPITSSPTVIDIAVVRDQDTPEPEPTPTPTPPRERKQGFPPTLLDKVVVHAEFDMLDSFYRFAQTKEYKKCKRGKDLIRSIQSQVLS